MLVVVLPEVCEVGRERSDLSIGILQTGDKVVAFVGECGGRRKGAETFITLGKLGRGETFAQDIELAPPGPVAGGTAEPDVGLDQIVSRLCLVGVDQTEIVLGDRVAGFGLRSQRSDTASRSCSENRPSENESERGAENGAEGTDVHERRELGLL